MWDQLFHLQAICTATAVTKNSHYASAIGRRQRLSHYTMAKHPAPSMTSNKHSTSCAHQIISLRIARPKSANKNNHKLTRALAGKFSLPSSACPLSMPPHCQRPPATHGARCTKAVISRFGKPAAAPRHKHRVFSGRRPIFDSKHPNPMDCRPQSQSRSHH